MLRASEASRRRAWLTVMALAAAFWIFDLAVLGPGSVLVAVVGAGLSIGFLWLTDDRFVPLRRAA
ncbi:MAG: hypothetical protein HYR73_09145 [Candidatus Eisenbacteria bacterium]|nr:hypothetical protein [Candidatus Eisenbacteria bacterium]